MQLILDMGNSTIVAALMKDGNVVHSTRIPSNRHKQQDFFEQELAHHLVSHLQPGDSIDVCALSSVVPELNDRLCAAATAVTHKPVYIITTELIASSLHIDVDAPAEVGKDRLCDCIGALSLGDNDSEWLIVIDMGTATTVNVVKTSNHAHATFIGGMIIPGVRTSLMALSTKASQLHEVRIETPPSIIGKNTIHCMQSGIVYGYATMIDGIIDRIREELEGTNDHAGTLISVFATGGMAQKIIPQCRHKIHYDEHLLLKGIVSLCSKLKS